ncbi:MAG: glycosyltransferase family 2 protein [bacterium]|nr:glycosyltransferase family 2 protein [bacterium]
MKPKSVSVVIPAYNEEPNIRKTVEDVLSASRTASTPVEIIIVDDHSTDKTLFVSQQAAKKNKNVIVHHNAVNRGLGYNFIMGIKMARHEYVVMIPGDNEVGRGSIVTLFRALQHTKADLLIPYFTNSYIRPKFRQMLSRLYVFFLNIMFGFNIRYYNGTVLYKTAMVKKLPVSTNGFAYQAEMVIRLLKSGASFESPGLLLKERIGGTSKALSVKSFLSVTGTILYLFWLINIRRWRWKG